MSKEQVRIDIATVIQTLQTDWTDYLLVVEMDNRQAVDQSLQVNPYLQVEVRHMKSDQADMSDNPLVRHQGQILLSVVSKQGTGTSDANKLQDFISKYFNLKTLGTVRCHAFEPYPSKTMLGWYYSPAIVNFWYHEFSK